MTQFNAIVLMRSELADMQAHGFDFLNENDREEYYATARKIQDLYNKKNIAALEFIAENNERYTAAEQRCADYALLHLYESSED